MATLEVTLAVAAACSDDVGDWERYWHALRQAAPGQSAVVPPPGSLDPVSPPVALGEGATPGSQSDRDPAVGGADILLRMWQEQRDQARQSENQRALITTLVVAVAAAALTVVRIDGQRPVMLWLTVPVILVGGFGMVVSQKYYERHQMHMTEAQALRRQMNDLFPHLGLEDTWASSRASHRQRYPLMYRIRLHQLWAAIPLAVAVAGVVTSILILT